MTEQCWPAGWGYVDSAAAVVGQALAASGRACPHTPSPDDGVTTPMRLSAIWEG